MYYKQPEYYSDFKCIGGDCRYTCCAGWSINWTDDEIEKVKNAPNCSEHLRSLMENSFKKEEGGIKNNSVILGEGGRCPMLTEDNMCLIQRELGAEYLSDTCSFYPRKRRFINVGRDGTYVCRCCNLSCPEVSKRLVTDKKAMNLISVPVKAGLEVTADIDREETLKAHPEYYFRGELLDLFYSMLSNKKNSVESSIIRGAFFMGILDVVIKSGEYRDIPRIMSDVRGELVSGKGFSEYVAEIKPDFNAKLDALCNIMKTFVKNNNVDLLKNENGEYSTELYEKGERNLEEIYGKDDFWLRNIALNLLLELNVPFFSSDFSIFENYAYFLVTVACIKLNSIACMSRSDEVISQGDTQFTGREGIWGFASVISRPLCQSSQNMGKIIKILSEAKLITPSAIAKLLY